MSSASRPATRHLPTIPPLARAWAPLFVLLLGLTATGVATAYVDHNVREEERQRFEQEVTATRQDLERRLDTYLTALQGVRGHFAAGGSVRRRHFRTYVDELKLARHYPAIQGIGCSIRMAPAGRARVTAFMRADGLPNFRIWPEHPRSEYHAIIFLEPEDRLNRRAFGYDMFTDPVRRAAMERARDTGEPSMSGRVRLVQEEGEAEQQPGFLIYLPVYRGNRTPPTVAGRRSALQGFIYSPFRAHNLWNQVFDPASRSALALAVYDGPAADRERLLYESFPAPTRKVAGLRPAHQRTLPLTLYGHQWTLAFATAPGANPHSQRGLVSLVLIAGLVVSLLLFAITGSQAQARAAAERMSAELRASEDELRRADRAKDDFLAMLGHELRNPLGSMSNAVEILRSRPTDDPPVRRARDVLERQIRHQTRLVDELLDVSRVTSGKITLRRQQVDLNECARRVVEGLRWAAEEQGHVVSLSPSPEHPVVEGDPARLEQVVSNLLHNAIKYTPPEGQVEVSVGREDGCALVSVRDTGIGIAPEMLARVFDLFAQGDVDIDRARGGLGIGLTLVRQLVELHGGTITAHSEGSGRGSEFIVTLPLRKDEGLPKDEGGRMKDEWEPVHPSAFILQPSRTRVLIIEDNPDARETLVDLLELWGYEVWTAVDGAEGIGRALELLPDVALVDIGLPGTDGYEVARRLRDTPATAGMQIVAVTGYGQPEDRRRAFEAGFDAHLVKPVQPDDLRRLLQTKSARTPEHLNTW